MSNTIISLTMKDWTVETRRPSIGFSGENEVVTLVISTEDDLSEFNEFYLDVGWQSYETGWKTNKNIIDLAGVGPLSVNLTANMLGPDGVKRMQLRATDGTRIRKSNVFEVLVKESVNAADYYDENKSLAETIGNLDDLQTTDKSNLVAAINEVNADVSDVKEDLGDLSDLDTSDKSSIVNAINEAAQSGGGDVVSIANIAKTGTVGLVDTYTITMTDGTTYTFTVTNGDADATTIQGFIDDWLEAHPEATTTVEDGAVTRAKLADSLQASVGLENDTDIMGDTSISEGTTTFEECFRKVYTEVMTAYGGSIDKIPIIAFTDQHGKLTASFYVKGTFQSIDHVVNWSDISKFINLGDCVTNGWINSSATAWLTCAELQNMTDSLAPIPWNKQVNVIGNHDTYTWVNNAYGDRRDEQPHLLKYFRTPYIQRYGNSGCMVIKDGQFNVKYLVLSAYDYENNVMYFKSEWVEMMIREMMADDGYDIIVVSHQLLNPAYDSRVFPTTQDMISKVSAENDNSYGLVINLNPLLLAKKNKTSGTFTDGQGVTHSYDFSKSSTRLLCGLSGHTHYETYNHVDGKFVGFALSPYTFGERWIYFLLVNRADDCINVWKMNSQSGAGSYTYTTYSVPFDVSEDTEYNITSRNVNTTLFNASTTIRSGEPYSQYIRPTSGKTLGNILITMGGDDITSEVLDTTKYLIHIPSVTGDINLKAYDSNTPIDTNYYVLTQVYDSDQVAVTDGSTNVVVEGGTFSKQYRAASSSYRITDYSLVQSDNTDITNLLSVSRGILILSISDVATDMTLTLTSETNTLTSEFIDNDGTITTNSDYYLNSYEDMTDVDYVNISLGKTSQTGYVAMYDSSHAFIKKVAFTSASQNIYLGTDTQYIRVGYPYDSSYSSHLVSKHTGSATATVTVSATGMTLGTYPSSVVYGDSLTIPFTYEEGDVIVDSCTAGGSNAEYTLNANSIVIPYVDGDIVVTMHLKTSTLYELASETTLTATTLDTGVKPASTVEDAFCYLLDYTIDAATANDIRILNTNGTGNNGTRLHRPLSGVNTLYLRYAKSSGNGTQIDGTYAVGTRVKTVLVHTGGSSNVTMTAYTHTEGNNIVTTTVSDGSVSRKLDAGNLTLGSPNGTITYHSFKALSVVPTAEEINAFLAFE